MYIYIYIYVYIYIHICIDVCIVALFCMIETGNYSAFNPIWISPLTVPHIYMSKIV